MASTSQTASSHNSPAYTDNVADFAITASCDPHCSHDGPMWVGRLPLVMLIEQILKRRRDGDVGGSSDRAPRAVLSRLNRGGY